MPLCDGVIDIQGGKPESEEHFIRVPCHILGYIRSQSICLKLRWGPIDSRSVIDDSGSRLRNSTYVITYVFL